MYRLSLGRPFCLLTFNYTTPILPHQVTNCNAVRNIHGTTVIHPIIGLDSATIPATSPAYQFSKTFRIMGSKYSKQNSDILTKNIKEVVFYGHSLGSADYSYFQSIFDYLDIYNNSIRLIFYYSKYDGYSIDMIKQRLFQQASRLFEVYGDSMDNPVHGKNLLHKLLLENRIIFTDITSLQQAKTVNDLKGKGSERFYINENM